MRSQVSRSGLVAGALLTTAALALPAVPASGADVVPAIGDKKHCAKQDRITVPGAQEQVLSCLDDLTTAGTTQTGHTIPADWAGLHAAGTNNPSGVPGIQVDGYFPDTSTFNTAHGWNHDAQFVIRLPDRWNGKLIITGAPGVRRQYSHDFIVSDWVLAQGYAYASTDKGNSGAQFYRDGTAPGDAVAEWHERVTELTVAAQDVVRQRYGAKAERTYMTGVSNGGYLTRWQLENRPELFDGGVDWEGTLFTADGPNLFTYLPEALRHYPTYADPESTQEQKDAAHAALLAAGLSPGSEFLWPFHYSVYWDLTQRIYREEFDPAYDGDLEAGIPFCQETSPPCDAGYDYATRPQEVKDAVARVSLTGRIGKPMITLHGTVDTLLPRETDSDIYTEMIAESGRSQLHRYYVIEDGNHVDGLYSLFPEQLRPILPCYRDALTALDAWVEKRIEPAASQFVSRPTTGDVVNTCGL